MGMMEDENSHTIETASYPRLLGRDWRNSIQHLLDIQED
jgi:hypothetical protein